MKRITGSEVAAHREYFERAAVIALDAKCYQARCGSVIVKGGEIIGEGYNGPPLNLESNRTCGTTRDMSIKPKYDKTCCIHAEWRAILNACKTKGDGIKGATLYFMRINETGGFTDAGVPYCTCCSRLALESGVSYFALWNNDGIDMYTTEEYDRASYAYSELVVS